MTALRWGAATDTGRRRTNNQDSMLAIDGLFAVADGMGGHAGGEVASLTAIEALRASFKGGSSEALAEAVLAANIAVLERAEGDDALTGMGTTMCAVAPIEVDGEERLAIVNVGDSRVYLLRGTEFTRLTEDHSVPEELKRAGQLTEEEAAVDPRKHYLTRVLGQGPEVEPDVWDLVPYTGDRLLLCSDGLTNEVTDDEIARVLRRQRDPEVAATELVTMANAGGGRDNITVVIVDVVDDGGAAHSASAALGAEAAAPSRTGRLPSREEREAQLRAIDEATSSPDASGTWAQTSQTAELTLPSRRFTWRTAAFVLVLVLLLGATAGAVTWYARAGYFVGLDDGRVTIFKGRPEPVLWFEPTVEQRTDLRAGDVPAARIDALQDGKTARSLAEARRYVANLEDEARATRTTTSTTSSTARPSP